VGAWKKDSKGNDVELCQADLEHIAKSIEDGCSEGEVCDKEDD
jgi:hypothetical protein